MAAANAADDVTVRGSAPEDGSSGAGESASGGGGESGECAAVDDVTAALSDRDSDSESSPEPSPPSSPESSPESSPQSSPEFRRKRTPEPSRASSPGASLAGSPTLDRSEAAAAAPESQYTSDDDEEKGSDRDLDGGRRLVECRNPVLCDGPADTDCTAAPPTEPSESPESAKSPVESPESAELPEESLQPGESPKPASLESAESAESVESAESAESAESVESVESVAPAKRTESSSHPLTEPPTETPSEEHLESSEEPSEPSESVTCADSRLELVPPDSDVSTDDEGGGTVSRFLRASMRKMFHFRLSSRGLRRRSSASQPSQASPTPSTRTATEMRATRAARRTSDERVCDSPAGDDQDSSPPPGPASGAAPTQTVRMSTLLDRLNGGAGCSSDSSASTSSSSSSGNSSSGGGGGGGAAGGSDVIQVSTRQPHLHDAPLPALEETVSVAFDTPPPPPLPAGSPAAERSAPGGSRANRLLTRGSSFLGVYQTVPELSDQEETRRAARGFWQHNYSSPLACLSCTVGLGAICRFALFGGTYGVAFVIQFFILSLLVGMPLMTLHMTMGQYIGSGIVDMWRISPIFKGIGLAAVFAEVILGVYTVVPISWMLVYLRDSFVSSYDRYKWAACPGNCTVGYDELVTYTVPQYFNQRVLQRNMSGTGLPEVGYLGFEISFNLAVTWILVYLSLGRGLRSYGKVVYVIFLLAMVSFFTVCIQLLSWTEGLNEFFTDKVLFDNVFWSTVPWVVAARETFMIWGLHGAALMAVTSHNKFDHNLRRDTTLVAFITLVILFLSALFGYACLHALRVGNISYIIGSSSFETEQRSRFLIAPGIGSSHSGGTPPEVKHYTNLVSGVIIKLSAASEEGTVWRSGYQVHRLATELFPSLLAVIGGSGISSFWALVFYLALLLFGVGQQLAIWRSVVEAVISVCPAKMRSWELTTTFVLCITGFGLSLPLMTEVGIHIIYFLDYCVGCLWWLVVIYVLELFAVFYIRGTPFASTQVVTILIARNGCMTNWAGPFLSFVWHVLLPMALLVLSVVSFRTGGFDAIFTWEESSGYGYWGLWVRQLGSMLMMFPILLVPVTGLIQAIRYVRAGEGDLYDRIQSLYRPEYNETMLGQITPEEEEERIVQRARTHYTDPPPKYTPPPSYSTATGARLAKMLRQSMRRSVRAVRQMTNSADRPETVSAAERGVPSDPPPSYASLLLQQMPAPLRRSMRRLSSSLRRPSTSPQRPAVPPAAPPAVLAEEGGWSGRAPPPPFGHQRSFSLGLLRQLPADSVPPNSRSLPRDLTPEQVREVLRSGRLSLPESAAPRQLTPDEVRQVLRGGTNRGLPRPASRAESLIDATLEEETTDA